MTSLLLSKPLRYAATNARCRALKSTLLEGDFYERALLAKTVGDLHQMLRESDYAPFLAEGDKKGLEKGVERAFSHLYRHLTGGLESGEREVFDLFFVERKRLSGKKAVMVTKGESGAEAYKRVDVAFVEELKTTFGRLDRAERIDLEEIVGSYFDLLNLYTVVRLRVLYGLDPEEIVPFLVPYGQIFDLEILGKAATLSTLSEISSLLQGKLEEPFGTYFAFRKVVNRHHLKTLHRVWYGYPFKISVIFSLLRLKEIETDNLRVLVEGVHYRLPSEEIKTMLVGV